MGIIKHLLVYSILFWSLTSLFQTKVFAQEPQIPTIDSISIIDAYPIISWVSNNDNTIGYGIRKRVFNSGIPIWKNDTVWGRESKSYTDSTVNACLESKWYQIFAFAPDSELSPWSDTLKTIFLEEPVFDTCENTITLKWTEYVSKDNQFDKYQILSSENGGPFNTINSVSFSQLSYVHRALLPDILYSYKIRAVIENPTGSSTSCERSIMSYTYDKPTFTNIRVATVEDDKHIRLAWEADDAPITKFHILRSETGSNYAFLAEILGTTFTNPATSFTDTSANFNSQSYYYSIDVFDFCGRKHLSSDNIARTILLSGEETSGLEITLNWNPYEGWPGGIEKFEVYQEVDGVQFPSSGPLATLTETETTYTNDVSGLGGGEGNFTYYVKAFENAGNNEVSQSNKITIQLETSISIPNAILPEGAAPDNEFKPLVDFIEQGFYSLTIYNKWGEQIFESKVVADGWDGTYKGEYVPAGAYVYLIKVRDARGQDQEKRGTVTVVR